MHDLYQFLPQLVLRRKLSLALAPQHPTTQKQKSSGNNQPLGNVGVNALF